MQSTSSTFPFIPIEGSLNFETLGAIKPKTANALRRIYCSAAACSQTFLSTPLRISRPSALTLFAI